MSSLFMMGGVTISLGLVSYMDVKPKSATRWEMMLEGVATNYSIFTSIILSKTNMYSQAISNKTRAYDKIRGWT